MNRAVFGALRGRVVPGILAAVRWILTGVGALATLLLAIGTIRDFFTYTPAELSVREARMASHGGGSVDWNVVVTPVIDKNGPGTARNCYGELEYDQQLDLQSIEDRTSARTINSPFRIEENVRAIKIELAFHFQDSMKWDGFIFDFRVVCDGIITNSIKIRSEYRPWD